MANVASKFIPSKYYSLDQFSIELIFLPSILDNITNLRVFNDDKYIISFLTSEGSYDDQIVNEDEHYNQKKQKIEKNPLLKSVVKLEDLYDLKDRFKKVNNFKLQSYTLKFELVNIESSQKPQNINLGFGLSSEEINVFINLLKKYKYIFA